MVRFLSHCLHRQYLFTLKSCEVTIMICFLQQLERQENDVLYFDTNDENKCNWMMFVRPADNFAEQNIVAYQHGFDIYFSVTKNIESRSELKVNLISKTDKKVTYTYVTSLVHLGTDM